MPLAERRRWFDAHLLSLIEMLPSSAEWRPAHTCPCCGYLTLEERGSYEICPVCWWEDDGQDDPRADEVWGGPNGVFSLADGRRNTERYGIMWPPGSHRMCAALSAEPVKKLRQQMSASFDEMRTGPALAAL
jgi:hypothetical protein